MSLFSKRIVYRSAFSVNEVLERVDNAIEKKGVISREYWTEPARFYRGRIGDNCFRLSAIGGSRQLVKPYIDGLIEESEAGSTVHVRIYLPGHDKWLIGFLLFLSVIWIVFSVAIHQYPLLFITPFIWIGLVMTLVFFKIRSVINEARMEDIFRAKGEVV